MKNYFEVFSTKKIKRVLSFDGGGVRAIAGVVFLKQLEVATGKSIFDLFDMFIGTSAGGMNALLVAMKKMSAEELHEFWSRQNILSSMSASWENRTSFLHTRPKYDGIGKTEILKKYLANSLMGECHKPVITLSYDVENRKPKLLGSIHTPKIKAVSAAMATSAAPIYYPTSELEDGTWHIDGGIVSNNPSLIGYVEGMKYFNTDKVKVLSIGAGIDREKIDGSASKKWGALGWLRNDVIGIMLEQNMDHEIALDLMKERYLRINSATEKVNKQLDDTSEINLERIHLMGMDWWSEFGDSAIKFVNN